MQRRPLLLSLACGALAWPSAGRAHHGWSSFDQTRPLWLAGRAVKVSWRNPHAELVLERPADGETLPADLAQRRLPAQSAGVDGAALLAAARLPTRRDRQWTVELAPLTRLAAWGVPEITVGTPLALLGFTFSGEKGDPVLRAEYLWLGDKVYGLRSSPA
jgi:Family of unknown function (DUF6152)